MDPSQIFNQILAAAGVTASQLPTQMDLSPGNILRSIFILVLLYIVARITRSLVRRILHRANVERRLEALLAQIVFYSIIALGVIWVLGGFGLSVVILGIAVGFALKDLIQNFASGLLIMGTRPFQEGDWVLIGAHEGRVSEVGWRGTFLDTFDGRKVIIPNANIITSVVVNNSLQPKLQSSIHVAVDLQSDFGRVEQLILDALNPIQGISKEPAPSVLIESLTGNAMNLLVSIWIDDPVVNQKRVISESLRAIKEALPIHDIDLNPATTVTMARELKVK